MNRVLKIAAHLLAVAVLVLACIVAAGTPARSGLATGQSRTAGATGAVLVPAQPIHEGGTGPLTLIGARSFPASPHLVTVRLTARSLGRPALMFAGVLTCGSQKAIAGINITTGSGSIIVRHIFTDPSSCTVWAQSALGRTSKDVLSVTASWSAQPVVWSRTSYRGTAWPTLVRPGRSYDAVPMVAEFPPLAGHVKVRADFRSTACTGTGGSRENGSPSLCVPPHLDLNGARFRLQLIASFGPAGRTCATRVLSDRTFLVDRYLHHAEAYWSGVLAKGCSPTVRIKLRVTVRAGASLLVNSSGTAIDLHR